MNERIEKVVAPLKNFWGKLEKKKRIILVSVVVGTIVLALAVVTLVNRTQYVELFGNLSEVQMREAFAALGENANKCKQENGAILVDKKYETTVRMTMATAGYPKEVPNNDYSNDNKNFMSTDSDKRLVDKQNAEIRAQAAIETINGVNKAIVTIVTPQDNNWAWEDDKSTASASVMLTLDGTTLDAKQVSGIKRVVATSVEGLMTENVAVTDQTGNELMDASKTNYMDISNFKLEIQRKFENNLKKNIGQVLAPVYGNENFNIIVTSNMDVDEKIKEIINYTPTGDDGKGMLEHSENDKEAIKPEDANGGVVGEQSNADLPGYAGVTQDGTNIYYKDYEKLDYLVNKATEQITSQAAKLADLTVSVTVNKKARVLTQQGTEELQALVANAAAISPAKVVIMNSEFAALPDSTKVDKKPIIGSGMVAVIMTIGTILLLAAVIAIIVINHKIKRKRLEAALITDADFQGAAAAQAGAKQNFNEVNGINGTPMQGMQLPVDEVASMRDELKNVPETKEQVLKKEIQDFSAKNPEIVAQLLRTWLRGDEDSDG